MSERIERAIYWLLLALFATVATVLQWRGVQRRRMRR